LQETSPTLKNPQKANKKESENNLVSNMEVQTWGSTFNILANNGFVIERRLSSCEPLTLLEHSSNLFTKVLRDIRPVIDFNEKFQTENIIFYCRMGRARFE
jgi:hypothetical protein